MIIKIINLLKKNNQKTKVQIPEVELQAPTALDRSSHLCR